MNYQDAQMLAQLVRASEDSVNELEEAFNKKNVERFNEAKKQLLNFQKQIAEVLSG